MRDRDDGRAEPATRGHATRTAGRSPHGAEGRGTRPRRLRGRRPPRRWPRPSASSTPTGPFHAHEVLEAAWKSAPRGRTRPVAGPGAARGRPSRTYAGATPAAPRSLLTPRRRPRRPVRPGAARHRRRPAWRPTPVTCPPGSTDRRPRRRSPTPDLDPAPHGRRWLRAVLVPDAELAAQPLVTGPQWPTRPSSRSREPSLDAACRVVISVDLPRSDRARSANACATSPSRPSVRRCSVRVRLDRSARCRGSPPRGLSLG